MFTVALHPLPRSHRRRENKEVLFLKELLPFSRPPV
jgi:hypothetical protein